MISTSSLTVWAESNSIGVGEGISADGTWKIPSQYLESPKEELHDLATSEVGASIANACNCVVFRFDDLQDFFIEQVQEDIMQEFIDRDEFFSIGPIPLIFGTPSDMSAKALEGFNSGLFEVFTHGYNHTIFSGVPLATQTTDIGLGKGVLDSFFGSDTNVFVPPFNALDLNTTRALDTHGFDIVSSEPGVDLTGPFYVADGISDIKDGFGIYHLPSTVKFVDFGPEPPVRISSAQILSDIDDEIDLRGYAIVTLHPQEFNQIINETEIDMVNATLFKDLTDVIDGVNAKNYPIRTFNQVVAFNGTVSIGNVTQVEGNSGTSDFVFDVTRSDTTGAMSVDYAVVDGTATVDDSDYNTIPDGTLAFTDGGVLTKTITVPVVGDSTEEPHETFNVNLSNCVGCNIVDAQGVGTITNDETTVSINNVTKAEGNSGITEFVFNATRSNNISSLSVDYTTADNSATQPFDYVTISGTLNFGNEGVLTKTITVSVVGDIEEESNETFFVNLSNCVGCTIESQGIGTIKSECETLPGSGNWIITNSCILENNFTSPANVLIQNGSVLTVPTGVSLSIPSGNNLTVLSGGGILIESNGTLIIIS